MATEQASLQTYRGPQQNSQYVKQRLDQLVDAIKNLLPAHTPSGPELTALAAVIPAAGIILAVAGGTLAATVIGLTVATPLLVIFSPVLVPAAIAVGLGVTGFLISGVLGLTGVSSFSYLFRILGGARVVRPDREQMEHAKRRVQEAAGHIGHGSQAGGERSRA